MLNTILNITGSGVIKFLAVMYSLNTTSTLHKYFGVKLYIDGVLVVSNVGQVNANSYISSHILIGSAGSVHSSGTAIHGKFPVNGFETIVFNSSILLQVSYNQTDGLVGRAGVNYIADIFS